MNAPTFQLPAFALLRPLPKPAILWKDTAISYADLLTHSAALASLYFSSPGERVVIFSENRPEWVSALLSIWRNRCVVVPVDAFSPAAELAYILGQTEPVAIFCSAKTTPVVQEALGTLPALNARMVCFDNEDFPAIPSGCVADTPLMAGAEDTLAAILFTSGTTGAPKGVMLTFGNIKVNLESVCDRVPIFTPQPAPLPCSPRIIFCRSSAACSPPSTPAAPSSSLTPSTPPTWSAPCAGTAPPC